MTNEYIYLVSNASTDIYNNKLTNFTNSLKDVYTRGNGTFEIALSEMIFDDKFQSSVSPVNSATPSIVLTRKYPHQIDKINSNEIPSKDKIFIPQCYLKTITELLLIINKQFEPISLWCLNIQTEGRYQAYRLPGMF